MYAFNLSTGEMDWEDKLSSGVQVIDQSGQYGKYSSNKNPSFILKLIFLKMPIATGKKISGEKIDTMA
jgi:hypothetical protein